MRACRAAAYSVRDDNSGGLDVCTRDGMSRRRFLELSAAAGVVLAGSRSAIAGAATMPASARALRPADTPFLEATIPELQALMAAGQLTSRELTRAYLQRIRELNPTLHAVIETEPSAFGIAARLDVERHAGRVRGPLHGIPVLVKDNVATADHTGTTAGSLALQGSRVPSDAPIVARLRDAGAVVFGKANLSEWANFRGFAPFNRLERARRASRAIRTSSTSILAGRARARRSPRQRVCAPPRSEPRPTARSSVRGPAISVVGLKPTVGLLAQEGIIPIAHSQDTAGPMARTVTDVAIVLGAMQSPFGPFAGRPVPTDYTQFLRRDTLRGARIGVDRRYFTLDFGGEPDLVALAEAALDAMRDLGATLVDTDHWRTRSRTRTPSSRSCSQSSRSTSPPTSRPCDARRMRSLADLIAFNQVHCEREMKYFGQELFEMAEETERARRPCVRRRA